MYKQLTIILLVGGLGTRIRASIGSTPKILAQINNKEFILYLLKWIELSFNEIDYEIVLATGFLHDKVQDFCIDKNLNLKLIREEKQLGTLGAANNAASISHSENILIMNGDTIIDCNLDYPYSSYLSQDLPLLVTKRSKKNTRYGGYKLDHRTGFLRSESIDSDLISLGLLFTKKKNISTYAEMALHDDIKLPMIDQHFISKTNCVSYILEEDTDFIDIGTPESFQASQGIVPSILHKIVNSL